MELDDKKYDKLVKVNISTVRNIAVYIAKFKIYTACSTASDCDFTNILEGKRLLDCDHVLDFIDNLKKRRLSWDLYALGNDLDPQLCTFDPFALERQRVAKLHSSLTRGFQLEKNWCSCEVEYLDDRRLFCQFSGGGDLFFSTSQSTATMLCIPELELSQNINSSPQKDCHWTHSSVIERSESSSYDSLRFQLMADMVIGCVKSFVDLVSKQPTLDNLQMDVISTYGIVCTGAGTVGLLKLEIDFTEKVMRFLEKVPLQTFCCRSTSAALLDLIILHVASSTSTPP